MVQVDPDAAPKRTPSLLSRLKDGAEETSTLIKAALLVLCVLAVGTIVTVAAWRDQTSHGIAVTLASGTNHELLTRGSDLDLRQALVDAINDRVRNVKAVALLQGVPHEVNLEDTDTVSFKPFGVDMSTTESNTIVRFLRHSPRHLSVAIELVCTLTSCDEPGARADSLLVTLSGPQLASRTLYRLPAAGAALRRALDQMTQHTADILLAHSEPLIASLYDLNMGEQDMFPDTKARDLNQATGLALSLRDGNAEDRCFADLVPSLNTIFRGEALEGVKSLARPIRSGNLPCVLRAGLLMLVVVGTHAVCGLSPEQRRADISVASPLLDALLKLDFKGSEQVAHRLAFGRLFITLARAIRDSDAPSRASICLQGGVLPPQKGSGVDLVKQVEAVMTKMRTELPANAFSSGEHLLLLWMRLLVETGIARQDLQSRYVLAHGILQFAGDYAQVESHPRILFILVGQMHLDIATIVHDALDLPTSDKLRTLGALGVNTLADGFAPDVFLRGEISRNLNLAYSAFGNALVTDTASKLDEPSPDIEPLILLGDAAFEAGNEAEASGAYARALDAFMSDEAPVNQIVQLAKLASHWSGLLRMQGVCSKQATPDAAWEEHWARLGGGPHDPCAPGKMGHPTSIFGLLTPVIQGVIADCYPIAQDDIEMSPDRPAAMDARFAALACQQSREIPTNPAMVSFGRSNTGDSLNDQIQRALAVPPT